LVLPEDTIKIVDKGRRIITLSAAIGFVVAVLIGLLTSFVDIFNAPGAIDAIFVFCPSYYLIFLFSDEMKVMGGVLAMALIAFINSGLYAVIAAAIVGLKGPTPD